jgi:hypothetical protein
MRLTLPGRKSPTFYDHASLFDPAEFQRNEVRASCESDLMHTDSPARTLENFQGVVRGRNRKSRFA